MTFMKVIFVTTRTLMYSVDWFKATQAAVCLAFVANLGAVVAVALFVFVSSLPEKLLKSTSIVFLVIAGNSICVILTRMMGRTLKLKAGLGLEIRLEFFKN